MDNSGATSRQPTKYTQCAGECLAQYMGHGKGHLGELGQNFINCIFVVLQCV